MKIRAKYEHGVFRPLAEVRLEEGTLVELRVLSEGTSPRKRRSIKALPFYGMWADRDDFTDGLGYVDKLRGNPLG